MNRTVNYMKERHQYWAQQLFDLGIFKIMLKPITFEVHYGTKTYNGVFRWRRTFDGTVLSEKIILYPKVFDVDSQWIDNILVHEMIHQYIFDAKIKDTSSHGSYFKMLMNTINLHNIGVKITVTSTFQKPEAKEYQTYKILVLKFKDDVFLCRIKPSKVDYFTNLIVSGKINWKSPLLSFGWYKTNHNFFYSHSECTSRLHGVSFPINKINEIFKEYKLEKFANIEEL